MSERNHSKVTLIFFPPDEIPEYVVSEKVNAVGAVTVKTNQKPHMS